MSTTVLCSSWLEPLECHSKKKSPEDDVERDFRSLCLFSLLRLFLNPKILIKQTHSGPGNSSNVYFSRSILRNQQEMWPSSSAKHSEFLRHSLSSRSQTKECWLAGPKKKPATVRERKFRFFAVNLFKFTAKLPKPVSHRRPSGGAAGARASIAFDL